MKKGPFITSKNKTSKMMIHLFIALLPIILFSFYKNGYLPYKSGHSNTFGLIYPLILMGTGVITSFFTETIYYLLIKKLKGKELINKIKTSYVIFPGLFLALVLPINTPLYLVCFGAFIATFIGKLIYGGFGKNIFNPALIGVLLILTMYGGMISSLGGYANNTEMFGYGEIDGVTAATPLSNIASAEGLGTYETLVEPYGGLSNFLFGYIPGSLGETSAFFCIIAFIYLTLTKTIKWRIPVFYVGTVAMLTLLLGGLNGLGLWYTLFYILSGGLLFGAVFMATDPVTSPVTKSGQIIYGCLLGLITFLLRFLTPYPEGVMTSILFMNMCVFLIDKFGVQIKFNKMKIAIPILLLVIAGITSVYLVNDKYKIEPVEKDPNNKKDTDFKVESKQENNNIIYTVTQRGFSSTIKAKVVFGLAGDIINIEILEQDDSYFNKIEEANFVNSLREGSPNVSEIDGVSGVTITSNALKKMIENVVKEYEKEYK